MTDRIEELPLDATHDPPRELPLPVLLRVLFGGMVSQMGWVFLGFGLIFVWIFVLNVDFSGPLRLLTRQVEGPGQVSAVEPTGFSEGGDDDTPGTPVYRITYQFRGPGGRVYDGASFSTGTDLQSGDTVRVEYAASRPESSRILGLRQAPVPMIALFVLIFPLIGLGMVVYSLKEGIKGAQLLRGGRLAPGTLLSAEPTSMTVNNRPVIRLTFDFTDQEGGLHEVVTRTAQAHLLQDQKDELVLYDPSNPEYAVMLDSLPGSPRIGPAGELQIDSPWIAYALTIVPALTVVGHGLYLLIRFGVIV